jgi:hypothetical protein
MEASSTWLPTRTTMPPMMPGSTVDERSILRPVCSAIRSPMLSTVLASSSTAEMIETGRRLLKSSQRRSYSRRMRKITGIRWFSSSSSRKLRKNGSAPSTILCRPSFFSCVEKYGEKKNTCSSWSASSASANWPS